MISNPPFVRFDDNAVENHLTWPSRIGRFKAPAVFRESLSRRDYVDPLRQPVEAQTQTAVGLNSTRWVARPERREGLDPLPPPASVTPVRSRDGRARTNRVAKHAASQIRRPSDGKLPCLLRSLRQRFARGFPKRKTVTAGKHAVQIEIVRQRRARGNLERDKTRARIRKTKQRPLSGEFVFNRRLRADLAGDENKTGVCHSRIVASARREKVAIYWRVSPSW